VCDESAVPWGEETIDCYARTTTVPATRSCSACLSSAPATHGAPSSGPARPGGRPAYRVARARCARAQCVFGGEQPNPSDRRGASRLALLANEPLIGFQKCRRSSGRSSGRQHVLTPLVRGGLDMMTLASNAGSLDRHGQPAEPRVGVDWHVDLHGHDIAAPRALQTTPPRARIPHLGGVRLYLEGFASRGWRTCKKKGSVPCKPSRR
jgi:hypothetical protein